MKYTVAGIISICLFIGTGLLNPVVAQLDSSKGAEKIIIDGKTFYLHKVKKGEGLYRLGVNYGVSQKEILEANPSAGLGLKEGQLLRIPVIAGRNSTTQEIQSEKYIYHTVEKGQTAFYIARRYKVDLEDIYKNNPGSKQQLLEGVIVKIPKELVNPSHHPVTEEGFVMHKVKRGEAMYGLSKKYGVSIADIIKYNEGLSTGVLSVGSYLRIPTGHLKKEADEVQDSPKEDYEDDKYYYHKIKAGETIFSIAQSYGSKAQLVTEANPSVSSDDLPLGYLVRIPKTGIDLSDELSGSNLAVLKDYRVKRRETVREVAARFDVSAEFLKKINQIEGIDLANWEKGMLIKVPTAKWIADYQAEMEREANEMVVARDEEEAPVKIWEETEKSDYDYYTSSPALKVALLMPFNVEATRRANVKEEEVDGEMVEIERDQKVLSMKSKVFVEFYQGTLLALDSLKKQGVNVDLFVYDTAPDTTKLNEILNKPELTYMDLLIGPAYSSNLKSVSDFSKQHDIPMVYPLSTVNDQMENNPMLFQANANDTLMFDKMATRIVRNIGDSHVIIIRSEDKQSGYEENLSQLLRDKIYWESFGKGLMPDFVEYRFKQDDLASLEKMLVADKKNVVIIPSNDEGQVNRIVSTLKGAVQSTKADVTLWGLPGWVRFNTVDPQDISKLNGHIFSYYAVDYMDEESNKSIETYRRWFGTEPMAISPFFQAASKQSNMSRYSLWGHDLTYFFVSALKEYGKNFPGYLHIHHPHTIQSNLQFMRMSNWGGFYNQGLYVLHFTPEYEMNIELVK